MSKNATNTAVRSPVARLSIMGSVLLLGAAVTAFSVNAWAGEGRDHRGSGHHDRHHHVHGMHQGKMGHAGFGGHGGIKQIDRLLGDAKLTEAQRKQIQDIRAQTRQDLKTLKPAGSTRSGGFSLGLLAQEKPDLAAAERERQARLSHHDQFTKRLLKEQADIANVLTPQQRLKIASEMKVKQERVAKRMKERQAQRQAAAQAASGASAPR